MGRAALCFGSLATVTGTARRQGKLGCVSCYLIGSFGGLNFGLFIAQSWRWPPEHCAYRRPAILHASGCRAVFVFVHRKSSPIPLCPARSVRIRRVYLPGRTCRSMCLLYLLTGRLPVRYSSICSSESEAVSRRSLILMIMILSTYVATPE